MIEYDFVEKVMKTWNPHTPEHDIVNTHEFMNQECKERAERGKNSKRQEYEAAGFDSWPIAEIFEGPLIEEEARKATIDWHLGEYLEEIEKRSRGYNYLYYAHLWTIQDPDGWRKTPWLMQINPELEAAVKSTFPNESGAFHLLMSARIEHDRYYSGEIPEMTDEYVQEVRDEESHQRRTRRNFDDPDFSHLTV